MPLMLDRRCINVFRAVCGSALLALCCSAAYASDPGSPGRPEAVNGEKTGVSAAAKLKPLFRDFMGLNTHTVGFKPDLYKPICRLIRDYHPVIWDVGDDTNFATRFPMARNNVDWEGGLYGPWKKAGYVTDACLMFEQIKPDKWKDLPRDAYAYGLSFARFFGPSGTQPLTESVEIGNEPGGYSDEVYRQLFENMAKGIRQGDPKLKISTCYVEVGKSGPYWKSLSCLQGLEALYDIINLHTYAFAEQYPTWRRSYPEDTKIKFLDPIKETIAWRNAHTPGKEIWVTEFGWDASTKPAPPTGDFSKWMSSTETQQAQYLVRSFLVFSAMDVDRAYIYFFDDDDTPQLHGSSGITRKFVPKPAFHSVAHLYSTLGGYRFARSVVQENEKLYVYEYRSGANDKERIWAVWSPTGSNRQAEVTLPDPGGKIVRAERMPLKAGAAEAVHCEVKSGGKIGVPVSESPVYLWIENR